MFAHQGKKFSMKLGKLVFDFYQFLMAFYVGRIQPFFLSSGKNLLPEIEDPLVLLPVTVLAEQIRTRKISSESVVKAYIKRSRDTHYFINAIVEDRFTEAVDEAKAADAFIQNSGKSIEELAIEKPLLGVPFSIKANISCKNMTYDIGSECRRGKRADKDAPIRRTLLEAGAIHLSLTNTPELCASWNSYNNLYGQTRNPHDLNRTSGGSSGGEGAIVAASGSSFGVGNDMAGSIRIPACLNGTFGHKPTKGVVSSLGIFPETKDIVDMVDNGPLCRYAGDLGTLLGVMAGENASKLSLDTEVDMKNVKVYYFDDDIGYPFVCKITEPARKAIKEAAAHFERTYGTVPQKIDIPRLKFSSEIFSANTLAKTEKPLAAMLNENAEEDIDLFSEILKACVGLSKYTFTVLFFAIIQKMSPKKGSAWYYKQSEHREFLRRELTSFLSKENAILLYPSIPEEAPFPVEALSKIHILTYFCLFNVLGFPVTQVPTGCGPKGLPIGIQVVGAPYKDYLTIAVAKELEKAFGGWVRPNRNRK